MLFHRHSSGLISLTSPFASPARCNLAPTLVWLTVARVEQMSTVWGITGCLARGQRAVDHVMRPPTAAGKRPDGLTLVPWSRPRGHVPPLDGDAQALQEEASRTLLSRDLSDPPPNLLNQLEGLLGPDSRSPSDGGEGVGTPEELILLVVGDGSSIRCRPAERRR